MSFVITRSATVALAPGRPVCKSGGPCANWTGSRRNLPGGIPRGGLLSGIRWHGSRTTLCYGVTSVTAPSGAWCFLGGYSSNRWSMQQAVEAPTPQALADLVARCKEIGRYTTQLTAAEESRIAALAAALLTMRQVLDLHPIAPEKLPLRQAQNRALGAHRSARSRDHRSRARRSSRGAGDRRARTGESPERSNVAGRVANGHALARRRSRNFGRGLDAVSRAPHGPRAAARA